MHPAVRNLISRAAAAVVGLSLIYGGWRCLDKGQELEDDARERRYRSKRTGGELPFMAGAVLLVVGVPTAAYAFLPQAWLGRFLQPKPMGFRND